MICKKYPSFYAEETMKKEKNCQNSTVLKTKKRCCLPHCDSKTVFRTDHCEFEIYKIRITLQLRHSPLKIYKVKKKEFDLWFSGAYLKFWI